MRKIPMRTPLAEAAAYFKDQENAALQYAEFARDLGFLSDKMAEASLAREPTLLATVRDGIKSFFNTVGDTLAALPIDFISSASEGLGKNTATYTQFDPVRDVFAEAERDGEFSGIESYYEAVLDKIEPAAQTLVLRPGPGPNPFDDESFDPEANPVASGNVKEAGAQSFTVYLPYAAGEGGQKLKVSLGGAAAGAFQVLADGQLLSSAAEFELTVPEGQRAASFTLLALRDVDADETLGLTAQLVDASGTPTHQSHLELNLALDATAEPQLVTANTEVLIDQLASDDPRGDSFPVPDASGWTVIGTANNDEIRGSGNGGADRFAGEGGDDELVGYGGDDELIGGPGYDWLWGGDGADRLYAEGVIERAAAIEAALGGQVAAASAIGEVLDAGPGEDEIYGAGASTIFAGEGADLIVGGAGTDFVITDGLGVIAGDYAEEWRLAGQTGGWVVRYEALRQAVVSFPTDSQVLMNWDEARHKHVAQIEGEGIGTLWLQMNEDREGEADSVYGGAGEDIVLAGGGDDLLELGAQDDMGVGGAGADILYGRGGNDWLSGDFNWDPDDNRPTANPDEAAGTDNDKLRGDGNDDELFGGEGDDHLEGDYATLEAKYHGADYLDGEEGADTLIGGGGADELFGGEGDDHLLGDDAEEGRIAGEFHGADTLDGEAGNDYLEGGGGADRLLGGVGNDILRGDSESVAEASQGGDVLDGGEGVDGLWGEGGDDRLDGGSGHDDLWGGDGADRLQGGTGVDNLMGEAGDDTYGFSLGDSVPEGFADTIVDAAGANAIEFGAGIARDDIRLYRNPTDGELVLDYSADDRLIVRGGFAGAVRLLRFADGSSVSLAELIGEQVADPFHFSTAEPGAAVYGGAAADQLSAAGGGSLLSGGRGNDTLTGSGGGNTYLYGAGDGTDRIEDTSKADGYAQPNTLRFGEGITPDMLRLSVGSLAIRVGEDPSDLIHLEGFDPQDVHAAPAIDRFEFADGTVLSYEQLLQRGFDLEGTEDDDEILGTQVTDRIAGGAGSDRLTGDSNGKVFYFGPLPDPGDDLFDGGRADALIARAGARDATQPKSQSWRNGEKRASNECAWREAA